MNSTKTLNHMKRTWRHQKKRRSGREKGLQAKRREFTKMKFQDAITN